MNLDAGAAKRYRARQDAVDVRASQGCPTRNAPGRCTRRQLGFDGHVAQKEKLESGEPTKTQACRILAFKRKYIDIDTLRES